MRIVWKLTVLLFVAAPAHADFIENFDDLTNTQHLTNSGGDAAAVMSNGGSKGNFARLSNLTGSNNNSIAFDEVAGQTGPAPNGLQIAFDFKMTGDAANDAAGGCCGSAADGLGLGLYSVDTYGATGASNPADGGAVWERPAHADAFTIGLDVFQNIDEVNINWGGSEVASQDVAGMLDLNNDTWHRAVVEVAPDGNGALVDVTIIEDIHGFTHIPPHSVLTGLSIPNLDLSALPGYRVIAGARTGGAFMAGDIDNIAVTALTPPIPEPSAIAILVIGLVGLLGSRRRSE